MDERCDVPAARITGPACAYYVQSSDAPAVLKIRVKRNGAELKKMKPMSQTCSVACARRPSELSVVHTVTLLVSVEVRSGKSQYALDTQSRCGPSSAMLTDRKRPPFRSEKENWL